ncbi:MAG: hypothetical protein ACOCRX_01430 [Candidatus Woesearchaeota archaeon]
MKFYVESAGFCNIIDAYNEIEAALKSLNIWADRILDSNENFKLGEYIAVSQQGFTFKEDEKYKTCRKIINAKDHNSNEYPTDCCILFKTTKLMFLDRIEKLRNKKNQENQEDQEYN